MSKENNKLIPFSVKLNVREKLFLKSLLLDDSEFNFQYEVYDAAICWAIDNKDYLVAIANSKSGSYKTCYLGESVQCIHELEESWDCNTTRAFHSALVQYSKYRGMLG